MVNWLNDHVTEHTEDRPSLASSFLASSSDIMKQLMSIVDGNLGLSDWFTSGIFEVNVHPLLGPVEHAQYKEQS